MEKWKDIKGLDGLYKVSNQGRILSLKNKRPIILKPIINNTGYKQVSLNGVKYLVHRLVAIAFLKNPSKYKVINHKDENPKNCNVDNLEWCSQSYNMLYSNNNTGSKAYKSTISESTAKEIFTLTHTHNAKDIAIRFNVSLAIVNKIKHGHAWNQVTGLPRVRYYKLKTAA